MNTSKLLKKAFAITALPLLLAVTATQVGCLGHAGPSEIAQGQRYESGDPTYDQFFLSVHDLSVQMSGAPKAEGQLRMEMAKELGVEPEEEDEPATPSLAPAAKPTTMDGTAAAAPSPTDAYEAQLKQSAINAIPGASTVNAVSAQVDQAKQTVGQFKALFGGGGAQAPEAREPAKPAAAPVQKAAKAPSATLIAKAVKVRSKKLGVEMKLTVDRQALDAGDTKTTMRTSGENPDGAKLARLVEDTAKDEVALVIKMNAAKRKLAKLANLGAALDANAEATFRKSRAKTSEVKKNLADAKALIELMESRANDVSKKATLMLEKLEQAAAANLEEPTPKKDESAVAKADPHAKPAATKAEERTAKAKPEEPAPKAKAKAKDHGPARAATPKTAMADFEP